MNPEQSPQELHEAAWTRPKLRRPARNAKTQTHSIADAEQSIQRQYMRCKETRPHFLDKSDQPGPKGQRNATTVRYVEKAHRELPPVQLAAYMAKEQGTQAHIEQMIAEVRQVLEVAATNISLTWRVVDGNDHPLQNISALIVEEWLEPAQFVKSLKGGGQPCVSAFASRMQCDNKTWHTKWKSVFYDNRNIVRSWYAEGMYRMTGEIYES